MEYPKDTVEDNATQEEQVNGGESEAKEKDGDTEEAVDPRWKDAEEAATVLGIPGIEGLREKQKQYREDIESRKEHVLDVKRSDESNLERVRGEMELLRNEMEAKKQTILSRIFEWKRIREIKKELTRNAGVEESYEEEIQGREKVLEQFDALLDLENTYEAYLDTLEQKKTIEAQEVSIQKKQLRNKMPRKGSDNVDLITSYKNITYMLRMNL